MNGSRYKTVLLFGAPGAGKGTQGRIIGNIPGFFHLSCGEVFRQIDITSEIGKIFVEYSSRGELVPDEITVEMWRQNMHARVVLGQYKPRVDLLVLDGIPRNVAQAELLEDDLEVLKICHLVCRNKSLMVERLRRRALKENRVDDAREDVILRRWEVYERESKPVLDYYPRDRIFEVDGTRSPAEVLQEVLKGIVPVQAEHYRQARVEQQVG